MPNCSLATPPAIASTRASTSPVLTRPGSAETRPDSSTFPSSAARAAHTISWRRISAVTMSPTVCRKRLGSEIFQTTSLSTTRFFFSGQELRWARIVHHEPFLKTQQGFHGPLEMEPWLDGIPHGLAEESDDRRLCLRNHEEAVPEQDHTQADTTDSQPGSFR